MEQSYFLCCLQDISRHGTNCMQASRINKFPSEMNLMIQGFSQQNASNLTFAKIADLQPLKNGGAITRPVTLV